MLRHKTETPELALSMNTSPYPIYVINLSRTPERKLHMQRQLDALHLDYQFVEAIDKYDLKSSEYRAEVADLLGIDKSIIERRCTAYFYDHFACALSHLKAYNLMVEHNNPVACILEDDIVVLPDFPKILHAAQSTSWDILMLSSHSRTIRYIPATNPNLQKNIEKFPEMDCALFPKLRRIKWFRRLLPPISTSRSQLDWTCIPKLQWWLLMLLSHSKKTNNLFKYSINAYKGLLAIYNPNHPILHKDNEEQRRAYAACKIGGLPVRASQQALYGDYDMAIPAELPTSGMAYLLTLDMANKCKEVVNSKDRMLIDAIPWHLHRKYGVKLRIITPPCVTAALTYLQDSARGA